MRSAITIRMGATVNTVTVDGIRFDRSTATRLANDALRRAVVDHLVVTGQVKERRQHPRARRGHQHKGQQAS